VKINVEIPDEIYSGLKERARREHRSFHDLMVQSIQSAPEKKTANRRRRRKPPIIESDRSGTLHLDNAKIYELIDFP
jgi:hypothetical protein